MDLSKLREHWPVMLVVLLVTLIFAVSLVFFQVEPTERACVLRWGKVHRVARPGLHPKWPWPMETVWTRDARIRTTEGKVAVFEEVLTKDAKNIVLTTFVCWRIAVDSEDADHDRELLEQFLKSVNTFEDAEEKLTEIVRSVRIQVIGRHNFDELVNIDPTKVKLESIEQEMLGEVRQVALENYGIDVVTLGIKQIGLPEAVTQKVNERMIADRDKIRQQAISEGEREATRIRGEADAKARITIDEATKEAKQIVAEGEAEAARMYDVFKQEPELAKFLRKLDALRKLAPDTTFVVGPNVAPFDILDSDAVNLDEPLAAPVGGELSSER